MFKLKTLRSASKRFRRTASGMFRYKHSCLRHILTKKSSKHKRHLRKKSVISKNYLKTLVKSLPHIKN